jgi:hypothetical protein
MRSPTLLGVVLGIGECRSRIGIARTRAKDHLYLLLRILVALLRCEVTVEATPNVREHWVNSSKHICYQNPSRRAPAANVDYFTHVLLLFTYVL